MRLNTLSHAYAARSLPPELIDHILGLLAGDVDALRECALVHSTWLPLSYGHLFRKQSVRLCSLHPDPNRHQSRRRGSNWFENSICRRYIRFITFIVPSSSRNTLFEDSIQEILAIVRILPILKSLALSGSGLLGSPATSINPLCTTPETLILYDKRTSPEDFALLAARFRSISFLSVTTLESSRTGARSTGVKISATVKVLLQQRRAMPAHRDVQSKCVLCSLDIGGITLPIFDMICRTFDLSQLTAATILVGKGSLALETLLSKLSRSAPNIESLTVLAFHRAQRRTISTPISFRNLRHVRTIGFLWSTQPCVLTMANMVLKYFEDSPVPTVTIVATPLALPDEVILKIIGESNWNELASAISPCANLKNLCFEYHLLTHQQKLYPLCREAIDGALARVPALPTSGSDLKRVLQWKLFDTPAMLSSAN